MATFSLGSSGITPGAPGVYINEGAGVAANAGISAFSTVYMLVEAPESAPVTVFPFNTPTAITSLSEYKLLVGGSAPEDRIPLLAYNCVNEFFQNAQVGDLRVVRVGTPDQIVEISFLPSGTKTNSTDLPTNLKAGDVVYVQMVLNGTRLVAGDGSTGYTDSGEWLGVPVVIPANYIAGDAVNNRKIASALASAVAAAIESNPSVRSSVYVRDFGLANDLDPLSDSDQGYVTIASTTFNAPVTVVTQVLPVGGKYVLMQNGYDIRNIVGQSSNLVRVPQDYIQCINTAFDGQQDQGYLITPTAYAQFDAAGRSAIGAAAAAHCASGSYKWMALADPGPFLVTDVNKYSLYTPHSASADLVEGNSYLVDNVIYKWVGESVSYNRATFQEIVAGSSPQTAIEQSVNEVPIDTKIGLLDNGVYADSAVTNAARGIVTLPDMVNYWPVTLTIQKVVLSDATSAGNAFTLAAVPGVVGAVDLNGTDVYVVAPPADIAVTGDYSLNKVFLCATASEAQSVLTAVTAAGGTDKLVAAPAGAITYPSTTGTCTLSYLTPHYDLEVTINSQTSDLIQNVTDSNQFINTNHLPATLQKSTNDYRLGFTTRTLFNPAVSVTTYAGTVARFTGAAVFDVKGHGLQSGQNVLFTRAIMTKKGADEVALVRATTRTARNLYFVTVIDTDTFVLSTNVTTYAASTFVSIPSGGYVVQSKPTVVYSSMLGGGALASQLAELPTVPLTRGRKYGFNSGTVDNQAAAAAASPAAAATNPTVSIYLNESASVLSQDEISAWGETTEAGWLPELELVDPGDTTTTVANYYCVPTVKQSYVSEAFLVPAINPILGGTYNPTGAGAVAAVTPYSTAAGLANGDTNADINDYLADLLGVYFTVVTAAGFAPDGTTAVVVGDRIVVVQEGSAYLWRVVPAAASGGYLPSAGQVLYGSAVSLVYTPEVTPPSNLWNFDAITSTEIISDALRGVGFDGVPQAVQVEAGVDTVTRLLDDSQRYSNPLGFIAFYGPYVRNAAGQFIPPSPYVTGVAVRRYRAEGYQFPPAGVKYQLADAVGAQIAINSDQQNLLNPKGCNAIRTLPGYPQTSVFIWGGRCRVNTADAQQRLYQFVNTRVILNVVYGSLRNAFDSQIFNVIDGFGVIYNQIISIGNNVLNQLYVRGALFGNRPKDAFTIICDERINTAATLEEGIVNAQVFVTPVPTLERIQIDLIRVAIGAMQNELDIRGLGNSNATF